MIFTIYHLKNKIPVRSNTTLKVQIKLLIHHFSIFYYIPCNNEVHYPCLKMYLLRSITIQAAWLTWKRGQCFVALYVPNIERGEATLDIMKITRCA